MIPPHVLAALVDQLELEIIDRTAPTQPELHGVLGRHGARDRAAHLLRDRGGRSEAKVEATTIIARPMAKTWKVKLRRVSSPSSASDPVTHST